jgi:hypothetical protein
VIIIWIERTYHRPRANAPSPCAPRSSSHSWKSARAVSPNQPALACAPTRRRTNCWIRLGCKAGGKGAAMGEHGQLASASAGGVSLKALYAVARGVDRAVLAVAMDAPDSAYEQHEAHTRSEEPARFARVDQATCHVRGFLVERVPDCLVEPETAFR